MTFHTSINSFNPLAPHNISQVQVITPNIFGPIFYPFQTERRYEKTINKCLERENEKLSSLESKMGSEEAQVMKLKETMELNQSRINAHPACIIQPKSTITTEPISAQTPTITANRIVSSVGGITPKGTQQVRQSIIRPTPYQTKRNVRIVLYESRYCNLANRYYTPTHS